MFLKNTHLFNPSTHNHMMVITQNCTNWGARISVGRAVMYKPQG